MQISCVAPNVRGLPVFGLCFILLKAICLLAEDERSECNDCSANCDGLSMFYSLPCGVVGWSPVCGCSISWSYSFFLLIYMGQHLTALCTNASDKCSCCLSR